MVRKFRPHLAAVGFVTLCAALAMSQAHSWDSKNPCEDYTIREESDLCQQWRTAAATEKVVALTNRQNLIAGIEAALLLLTLGATAWAARAAAHAANAANASVAVAENTAKLELRAYISVEPEGINRKIKSYYTMGHVALRNVGKLPARDVSLFVRMTIADRHYEPPFSENEFVPSTRTIQPGAEMGQGSKESDAIKVEGLVNHLDKHVFVWGVAQYNDGYGQRRLTRFCHRYAIASYNRDPNWNRLAGQTECLISADKARYHETGNEAD